MSEWFYKATSKKVGIVETGRLAREDGFLCRSAFTKNKKRAARTRRVKFGDIIHMYFSQKGQGRRIGSFEVIRRDEHPQPASFGAMVSQTCLFAVDDPSFEARLRSLAGGDGYRPDPVVHAITGWLLRERPEVTTPTYQPAMFPPRATLVEAS